jgi:CBS domain-containing protein
VDAETLLKNDSVMRAFPRPVPSVAPELATNVVLQRMRKQADGSVVVCENGHLVGIFTERDALKVLARGESLEAPIKTYMVASPTTVLDSDVIMTAIEKMSAGGFRRLPIVDDEGHPVGMLGVAGILHYLVQHLPKRVYNLAAIPQEPLRVRS